MHADALNHYLDLIKIKDKDCLEVISSSNNYYHCFWFVFPNWIDVVVTAALSVFQPCIQQTKMNDSSPFWARKSVGKLRWKRIWKLKNPQQCGVVWGNSVHYSNTRTRLLLCWDSECFFWGCLAELGVWTRTSHSPHTHEGSVALKLNFHSGIHTNINKRKYFYLLETELFDQSQFE